MLDRDLSVSGQRIDDVTLDKLCGFAEVLSAIPGSAEYKLTNDLPLDLRAARRERDAALAEVARLRAELDRAR